MQPIYVTNFTVEFQPNYVIITFENNKQSTSIKMSKTAFDRLVETVKRGVNY